MSTDCTELLKIQKTPFECCQYPRMEANDEIVNKCDTNCPRDKLDTQNCCYRSCLFTMSGIYESDKFNENKCVSSFTIDEHNENADSWRKVVTESVKRCHKEGKDLLMTEV